jgi:hypothetical protein
MLTKRYGFRLVLPSLMMAWGTVCMVLGIRQALSPLTLHVFSVGTGVDPKSRLILRDESLDWCL